jgi:multidrug resistance efflux pump
VVAPGLKWLKSGLDQHLRQVKADLKNAEANLKIADITATRWQNLLKTDSISHQEVD